MLSLLPHVSKLHTLFFLFHNLDEACQSSIKNYEIVADLVLVN